MKKTILFCTALLWISCNRYKNNIQIEKIKVDTLFYSTNNSKNKRQRMKYFNHMLDFLKKNESIEFSEILENTKSKRETFNTYLKKIIKSKELYESMKIPKEHEGILQVHITKCLHILWNDHENFSDVVQDPTPRTPLREYKFKNSEIIKRLIKIVNEDKISDIFLKYRLLFKKKNETDILFDKNFFNSLYLGFDNFFSFPYFSINGEPQKMEENFTNVYKLILEGSNDLEGTEKYENNKKNLLKELKRLKESKELEENIFFLKKILKYCNDKKLKNIKTELAKFFNDKNKNKDNEYYEDKKYLDKFYFKTTKNKAIEYIKTVYNCNKEINKTNNIHNLPKHLIKQEEEGPLPEYDENPLLEYIAKKKTKKAKKGKSKNQKLVYENLVKKIAKEYKKNYKEEKNQNFYPLKKLLDLHFLTNNSIVDISFLNNKVFLSKTEEISNLLIKKLDKKNNKNDKFIEGFKC